MEIKNIKFKAKRLDGKGWVCEKSYHKEAQDGYAAENNIELED